MEHYEKVQIPLEVAYFVIKVSICSREGRSQGGLTGWPPQPGNLTLLRPTAPSLSPEERGLKQSKV